MTSSRMAPMIAVSQVLMSKNSSTVSRPNRTWARNPPRMAPTIPMMIVTMMPPGSSPGRIALAMAPASRPSTIQPMMPISSPTVKGSAVRGRTCHTPAPRRNTARPDSILNSLRIMASLHPGNGVPALLRGRLVAFALVSLCGGQTESGDGPVVDGQDLQLPAVDLDSFAGVGQAPEAVEDQAGHARVRPLRQGDAQIRQIMDGEGPGQEHRPVGFTLNAVGVAVELVIDVPDQLFQQVLDGHDALGAAVLVDHDRQGLALGLHASQGVQDPHRLGQGQRRADMVGDAAVGV